MRKMKDGICSDGKVRPINDEFDVHREVSVCKNWNRIEFLQVQVKR
jgi:hypothetical protein